MSNRKYQYKWKVVKVNDSAMPTVKIDASNAAYEILKPEYEKLDEFREHFLITGLDRANNVIGTIVASSGGLHGTVVDVRIIMKHLIEMLACGVILSHNHPSGNLKPSNADDRITNQIREACKIMEVNLLDHLIVTANNFYSYADNGKM